MYQPNFEDGEILYGQQLNDALNAVMASSAETAMGYVNAEMNRAETAEAVLQDNIDDEAALRASADALRPTFLYLASTAGADAIGEATGLTVQTALNSKTQIVDDVTAARALTGNPNYSSIFIKSSDGGLFVRDPSDVTSSEDSTLCCGTIIRTADYATNGVYKRQYTELNTRFYLTQTQLNSVMARNLTEDVTVAVQEAINAAITRGQFLRFFYGFYKITDTLNIANAVYKFAARFGGPDGLSTRLYFFNATSLKDFIFIGAETTYLSFENMEFVDNTARTSRCFHLGDNTSFPTIPSWKFEFRNVRVSLFKEGSRYDGGATPGSDTQTSEVFWLNSKFRNCETSVVYNNIQAVNHHYIGTDFENDDAGDVTGKWTIFKFERSSYVNHIGGSVIGYGAYVKFLFTSDGTGFQGTSGFQSTGVRMETRGDGPFIDEDPNSNISPSNTFKVTLKDTAVVATAFTTPVFSRMGGRCRYSFQGVRTNTSMFVDAYMTTNLSANGQYGSFKIDDCNGLVERRVSTTTAYGSAGVASTNYRSIPGEISCVSENTIGQNDAAGYFTLNNRRETVYSGSYQTANPKSLVFAPPDNTGFGSGSDPVVSKVNLPLNARPCKFRLLRHPINASSSFTFTLRFVNLATVTITNMANNGSGLIRVTTSAAYGMATGDGVTISGVLGTTEANGDWTITVINSTTFDLQGSTFTNAYISGGTFYVDRTVATITMGANVLGHAETSIANSNGNVVYFNDGVNWDGKMKIIKSGTTNGFVGLVIVDYM